MACGDVLSLEDLQTAKKHQLFEAEVITGLSGGVAGGAAIDYATNQVTGQTQKTLPAVLRDAGFRPASFTFATGGTLTIGDSDMAVLWPVSGGGDGQYYIWKGAYPKTIPSSSSPASTGGVSASGWLPLGDITLRGDLASPAVGKGVSLVNGAAKQTDLVQTNSVVTVLGQEYNRSCAVIAGKLIAGTAIGSKFHFFGDSTMWGSNPEPNTTTQQATNPPAMFKIAIDILYPGNGTTVANKAIAGSNLYSLLRGINHYYPTSYEQMLQADTPTIAFMGHCLNDCSSADGETNISQYYADLVTFVDVTRKYGVIPVLVTPAMHSPLGSGTLAQTKRQESFIQAMRDVAAKKEVDLVDSNYYMKQSLSLWKPMAIAPDGVHLSPMFSSQHGFNMLIPLVRAHTLKRHGDVAGLSTTMWQDNLPNTANKITNQPESDFGPTLLGDGSATELKINFPIILHAATRHQFLAFGGYSWPTHGVSSITYFDSYGTTGVLSGSIDASTVNASNNALFAPSICRLPAGLTIVGVKLPANTQIGKVFTFSGVKLLDRIFSGHGVLAQAANTAQPRDILVGDVIVTSSQLNPGSPILTLNECYDPAKVAVNIYWKTAANAIVIDCQGTSTTLWASPPDNEMAQLEVIIDTRGLIVKLGGITKTITGLANNHPRMYVANVTPYTVIRQV